MKTHLQNLNYAYCFAVCLLQVAIDYVYAVRVITKVLVQSIIVFALPIFIIVITANATAFYNRCFDLSNLPIIFIIIKRTIQK